MSETRSMHTIQVGDIISSPEFAKAGTAPDSSPPFASMILGEVTMDGESFDRDPSRGSAPFLVKRVEMADANQQLEELLKVTLPPRREFMARRLLEDFSDHPSGELLQFSMHEGDAFSKVSLLGHRDA